MFGKQRCPFCGNKTGKKYLFCPYCGKSLKEKNRDEFFTPSFKLGFPFNSLIRQMEKQIEKQFKELDAELGEFRMPEAAKRMPVEGLSISISSSSNGPPIIKVRSLGDDARIEKEGAREIKKIPQKKLSEEEAEKISKLPKEEPKTSVRRLTDKIIYEIEIPEVKKENIIINKLQNSIEIKAFSKDKAFFKLIPLALPILKSELKEGKLILELRPEQ